MCKRKSFAFASLGDLNLYPIYSLFSTHAIYTAWHWNTDITASSVPKSNDQNKRDIQKLKIRLLFRKVLLILRRWIKKRSYQPTSHAQKFGLVHIPWTQFASQTGIAHRFESSITGSSSQPSEQWTFPSWSQVYRPPLLYKKVLIVKISNVRN